MVLMSSPLIGPKAMYIICKLMAMVLVQVCCNNFIAYCFVCFINKEKSYPDLMFLALMSSTFLLSLLPDFSNFIAKSSIRALAEADDHEVVRELQVSHLFIYSFSRPFNWLFSRPVRQ